VRCRGESKFFRFVGGVQQGGLGVPVLAGRFPAETVDRPVAGGGDGHRVAVLLAEHPFDLRGGQVGHAGVSPQLCLGGVFGVISCRPGFG
jgi:hypothetical protein